jgi:hypothetical protein
MLPPGRWALTPPFHPYRRPNHSRCPGGFPPGYHRVSFRRRYILCGTFRDTAAAVAFATIATASPGVTRRVALHLETLCRRGESLSPASQSYSSASAEWCPDFPPAQFARAFRGRRSSGSPATSIISRVLLGRLKKRLAVAKLTPQQFLEFGFGKNCYSKFLGLVLLRTWVGAYYDVVCFFADRSGYFATVLLH